MMAPVVMPPIAPPLNEDLDAVDEAVAILVTVGERLVELPVMEEDVVLVTVVDAQWVNVLLLYVA